MSLYKIKIIIIIYYVEKFEVNGVGIVQSADKSLCETV